MEEEEGKAPLVEEEVEIKNFKMKKPIMQEEEVEIKVM